MLKKLHNITLFDRILIAGSIFGLLFLGYILFRKSTYVTAVIKVGEDTIRYEPWQTETGSRQWFSLLFREGMVESDGLNKIMAEVLSVRSYDTSPVKRSVYLTVRLNSVYNRASNQYTYKGSPLLIGSIINLNLDRLKVQGLVTFLEGVPDPRTKIKLKVTAVALEENPTFPETSGIKPYLANAIHVGDEFRDSQNQLIFRIINKKVEDAVKLTTNSSGQIVTQRYPLKKDVTIELEVNALKIADRYFLYDDVPIQVGLGIPINLPDLFIVPEVTSISVIE